MTRFVGLLRGVNVGGRNRLSMADLRALVEGLGCDRVATFIQSGNVLFDAPAPPAPARLEQALRDETGLDVDVVIRSGGELARVVAANPFADRDAGFLHVAFLAAAVDDAVASGLARDRFAPDAYVLRESELYLHLPTGMGRSKLAPYLVRALGVSMTVRNWATVCALAELAQSGEGTHRG